MRVTSSMITEQKMKAIQNSSQKLLKKQQQVTTGKKFVRPSDDPKAVKDSLRINTDIKQGKRYQGNIKHAQSRAGIVDVKMGTTSNILTQALTTAISGAKGIFQQSDRDALAQEVNESIESLANIANSKQNNEYIFSGTKNNKEAFSFTRDIEGEITAAQYNGNDSTRSVKIKENQEVEVTYNGDDLFSKPFEALVKLRDTLQNKSGLPDNEIAAEVSKTIEDIKNASEVNLTNQSKIGSQINLLENSLVENEDYLLQKQSNLSDAEDVDLAQSIIELQNTENTYQASIYMAARSSRQGGLLDMIS